MIFYELYTLSNSTVGMDNILVDTVSAVPAFTPLLLLFVFFLVFLSGVGKQQAKTGSADYPMWATVASMATFMIALIMTLVEGIIRLEWLVIVVVVTIFSGVWLFLDKRGSEV